MMKKADLGADTKCRHQRCDLGHVSLRLGFFSCVIGIKIVLTHLVALMIERGLNKVFST